MSPLIQAVRKVLDISTEGIFYESFWFCHEDRKSRLQHQDIQKKFITYIKEDNNGDKLPDEVEAWCLAVLTKKIFTRNCDRKEAGLSLS